MKYVVFIVACMSVVIVGGCEKSDAPAVKPATQPAANTVSVNTAVKEANAQLDRCIALVEKGDYAEFLLTMAETQGDLNQIAQRRAEGSLDRDMKASAPQILAVLKSARAKTPTISADANEVMYPTYNVRFTKRESRWVLDRARFLGGPKTYVACASNLRQIGQGIMLFVQSTQAKEFPPDLGPAFTELGENPRLFLCPCSGRTVPADFAKLRPEQQIAWINANSDYVYIGKGIDVKTAGPQTIVAYEELGHRHPEAADGQQWINVLYGDGHVSVISEQDAQAMINRLDAATQPGGTASRSASREPAAKTPVQEDDTDMTYLNAVAKVRHILTPQQQARMEALGKEFDALRPRLDDAQEREFVQKMAAEIRAGLTAEQKRAVDAQIASDSAK